VPDQVCSELFRTTPFGKKTNSFKGVPPPAALGREKKVPEEALRAAHCDIRAGRPGPAPIDARSRGKCSANGICFLLFFRDNSPPATVQEVPRLSDPIEAGMRLIGFNVGEASGPGHWPRPLALDVGVSVPVGGSLAADSTV
jgi:hypothetical protein